LYGICKIDNFVDLAAAGYKVFAPHS